ncbi:MAG: M14 family zinc carboxypeptidase, partial [Clostridia bacterium]
LDSVSYNSVGQFNVSSEITAFGALNKNRELTVADEILNQKIISNLDLQTANEKNINTKNSNLELNVANSKNIRKSNLELQIANEKNCRDIDFDSVAKFLVETNGGSENFADWKANARAVDLNVNFDAKWGSGESNLFFPYPSNYVGQFACSESETRALVDITNSISPTVTLSYHARGEVIYHGFDGVFPFAQVAEKIASSTGYALESSRGSAGGYKDWFVATRRKLGLTIEVGKDATPCDELEDYLYCMRKQNAEVLDIATQLATNC